MDPGQRCKSEVCLVFCRYPWRSKWGDGFSFSRLVTSLSPLCSDMFAVSWTNLLQVSILYAHRFMVSGFCLWFRLGHVSNALRLSLSRCHTPKKNKQWTCELRSTTTNLSAVIQLRTFFLQSIFMLLYMVCLQIYSLLKMFCSYINVSIAYKL